MIDGPGEAVAAVAATRYPPEASAASAARWPERPLETVFLTILSPLMRRCLDRPGGERGRAGAAGRDRRRRRVDAVFIGPADLAASMGKLGSQSIQRS